MVLAGDPRQLGPLIRNSTAKKKNLHISMLERLMRDGPCYQRRPGQSDPYDPTHIVKLVNNYRSHRELLVVPNELFYDNELVPTAPSDLQNMFGITVFLL